MKELVHAYEQLKTRNAERDKRMREVALVRSGNADQVFRGLFPEGTWSRPIIANLIDVVARDVSEQAGVLPTITAAGDSSLDDSQRTKADKRTKIANYYVASSRLGTELLRGADQLGTYGFCIFRVEPNFKEKRPHIHVENSMGAYYDMDRFGEVSVYCRSYYRKAGDLAAKFPELADKILQTSAFGRTDGNELLEDVRWTDKNRTSSERDALRLFFRLNLGLRSEGHDKDRVMEQVEKIESASDFENTPQGMAQRWGTEITASKQELNKFHDEAKKILARYLDKRDTWGESESRVNLFWSTMKVLLSMLYARPPKADVSRAFQDFDDDQARVASTILQRLLNRGFEEDVSAWDSAVRQAIEDWLIVGMGQIWLRYEVETEEVPESIDAMTGMLIPATERIVEEDAPVDYVHFEDFFWSPARTWSEVRWVARRVYMTKDQLEARFGEEIARVVPMTSAPKTPNPMRS